MGLQVTQALHQLLGGVRKPAQLQANPDIQLPQNDSGGYRLLDKLGALSSTPQQQNVQQGMFGLQPAPYFNQQAPQVGVTYHSLKYLASLAPQRGTSSTGALPPDMVNVPWSSEQIPYSQSLTPPNWYIQQQRSLGGKPINLRSN